MKTYLYIFGPANGSVAYGFPQFQKAADDSLFLASSECELSEQQTVFRLNRIWENGVSALRIGAYRQVFEQGMNRLGHSFGAAFYFTSSAPRGQVVAQTLNELIAVIQQNCVLGSQFCNDERFAKFLSNEIQPSFDGIVEQLNPSNTYSITAIPLDTGQSRQLFSEVQPTSVEQVGTLIEWFASDPSAILCDTLIIGAKIKVGQSFRPLQIQEVAKATTLYLYNMVATFNLARNEAASKIRSCQDIIDSLNQNIVLLNNTNATSQRDHQLLKDKISSLSSGFNGREDKVQNSNSGLVKPLSSSIKNSNALNHLEANLSVTDTNSEKIQYFDIRGIPKSENIAVEKSVDHNHQQHKGTSQNSRRSTRSLNLDDYSDDRQGDSILFWCLLVIIIFISIVVCLILYRDSIRLF